LQATDRDEYNAKQENHETNSFYTLRTDIFC